MPRTVYRIVTENPPSTDDYLSYADKGIVVDSDDPEAIRMANGLSVLLTLEAARKKGKSAPWRGDAWIATYTLPDDASFVLEQTGKRKSHYTLWCDRDLLHSCLANIVPVKEDSKNV